MKTKKKDAKRPVFDQKIEDLPVSNVIHLFVDGDWFDWILTEFKRNGSARVKTSFGEVVIFHKAPEGTL